MVSTLHRLPGNRVDQFVITVLSRRQSLIACNQLPLGCPELMLIEPPQHENCKSTTDHISHQVDPADLWGFSYILILALSISQEWKPIQKPIKSLAHIPNLKDISKLRNSFLIQWQAWPKIDNIPIRKQTAKASKQSTPFINDFWIL